MLHDRCSYWLFPRLLLKEETQIEIRRLIPGQKNPARISLYIWDQQGRSQTFGLSALMIVSVTSI